MDRLPVIHKDHAEAVVDFKKELTAHPDFTDVVLPLAWAERENGDDAGRTPHDPDLSRETPRES